MSHHGIVPLSKQQSCTLALAQGMTSKAFALRPAAGLFVKSLEAEQLEFDLDQKASRKTRLTGIHVALEARTQPELA